jgi:hypothetical protein
MKLFVQARKDGYNILYPKPTPSEFFHFAGDIRPESKGSNLLGKYLYTISISNAGCIFTKHVIVQDVQRQGLGNIGFSIFISHNKKLSGSEVIKLLDELLNTYCNNYCPDYYLDKKTENWEIFEAIKNQYKLTDLSNVDNENYQQGTADPAFYYYIDKEALHNIFDNPYQEEFSAYKQVFFVKKNLENEPDNPLLALPHDPRANLTEKIDFENPKYKLIYNQQSSDGVKIEVKVNGSLRQNTIYSQEDLQIIWSKQFCEPKEKKGKWYEIGSDWIEINPIERTLTVKEKQLDPSFRTFKINLEFNADPPDSPPTLFLKFKDSASISESFEETKKFKEEDINKGFYLSAACADLTSNQVFIGPNFRATEVVLTLNKRKRVRFVVLNERRKELHDFELKIIQKEGAIKNGFVDFWGDEIKKVWKVQVSHKDYETHSLEVKPDEKAEYEIKLTPKAKPRERVYYLQVNKIKGRQPRDRKGEKRTFTNKSPENRLECQPNFGFKFIGWQGPEPYADYDGRYIAVFEQLWYLKVLKVSIVVFPIFLASIIYILNSEPPPQFVDPTTEIMSYVEGVELNKDTLEQLKQRYCNGSSVPTPKIDDTPGWNLFSIFATGGDENHAGNRLDLNACCQKINEALDFRRAINLGEIDELKSQAFLAEQHEFKAAIDSIEEKYKKQIRDTLYNLKVSAMDLNQIATLILETQRTLRAQEAVEIPVQVDSIAKAPGTVRGNPNPSSSPPASSLEQSFFKLVNSGNTEKGDYDKLKTKYKGTGGPIMDYLNKICKNGSTFEKFVEISDLDRKKAKSVEDIKIND